MEDKIKHYWVCEYFPSDVGLYKAHASYTEWWRAWWHTLKLNWTHVGPPKKKFYVAEHERPTTKDDMI